MYGPGQIDGRTSEGDAAGAAIVGEGMRGEGVKTAAQTIIPFPLYKDISLKDINPFYVNLISDLRLLILPPEVLGPE